MNPENDNSCPAPVTDTKPAVGNSPDVDETGKREEKKKQAKWSILSLWHIFILVILLALFIYQNYNFLENNTAPPYADTTHHLLLANEYYRFMILRDMPLMNAPLHQKYPPLIYVTAAAFMGIWGMSIKVALWSYLTFAIVLLFSLYGVGSYFGGKLGGIAVAAIGISNHFVMYMSHMFVPELPQTAMTALALYALLKTERFTRKGNSYLFGIALALAMLTKWSSAFYLLFPIAILVGCYAFRSWKTFLISILPVIPLSVMAVIYLQEGMKLFQINPGGNAPPPSWAIPVFVAVISSMLVLSFLLEKKILNWVGEQNREHAACLLTGIRALLIALLVCGVWYVYSIQGVVAKLRFQRQEVYQPMQPRNEPLILFSLKHYLASYTNFPLPYYLFAIIGMLFAFLRKQKSLEFIVLFSMILSGVPLISATAPPAIFYILTVFFVLSVFAGYWIEYAWKLKYPLLILILLISIFSLIYPVLNPKQKEALPLDLSLLDRNLALSDMTEPDSYNYRIDEIIGDIQKYSLEINPGGRGNRPIPVGVFTTDSFTRSREKGRSFVEPWVFPCFMRYRGMNYYFPFTIEREWDRRLREFRDDRMFIVLGYLDEGYPEKSVEYLKREFHREARIVTRYEIDKYRKMALLIVGSEGTPGN